MDTPYKTQNTRSRAATLRQLRATVLPSYISPSPTDETLRQWFDRARIPRLKANPHAKRGGGQNYYSVAAVEKFLSQMLPGRMTDGTKEAA